MLNNGSTFKFVIVRHPWMRLVSGYQSKMVICNGSRECLFSRYQVPLDLQSNKAVRGAAGHRMGKGR